MPRRRPRPSRPDVPRSAAGRLELAERLYRDYCALTPYPRPRPFVKSFKTFAAYERWKRAQKNPWF